MPTLITTELLRTLPAKDCTIRDAKLTGFMIRCRASGRHSYRVELGRGRVVTIGKANRLAPAVAREQARRLIADDVRGHDPIAAKKALKSAMTFKAFLTDRYEPWTSEQHKTGRETVQRVRKAFGTFETLRLTEITAWAVEKWRTGRLKAGARPGTVNTHIVMLKAVLAKAVEWGLLPAPPLASVKRLQTDRTGRVRYLTPAEEARLRKALTARDKARVARRATANTWRRDRGYAEWPAAPPDHLTPIVLLALNTGLRRGELFNLRWSDVDVSRALLTVRGEGSKTAQTRRVPLNADALALVEAHRPATATPTAYLFPGRDDEPLDDIKKSWGAVSTTAKLIDFTFHDLRHTFASKLVMSGIDLNTVRELLGHSTIQMTLRYAHLAPEHKAAAVAKLVVNR